jgi:phosphoribosylanthranilate isomerase
MERRYKPSVKICGIRDEATLLAILPLPIDHIGFVFAESKRKVALKDAGAMIRLIKEAAECGQSVPLTAGVFVNPTMEELESVMAEAPLDIIQLHGNEQPAFCRQVKERFGVQVFKSVSVSESSLPSRSQAEEAGAGHLTDPQTDRLRSYANVADALLLDTYDPVVGGGTGKTFAWDRIPDYLGHVHAAGLKLLVAGGLESGNVRELINRFKPDGVDVSSGVETNGTKDIAKIQTFVERVKLT